MNLHSEKLKLIELLINTEDPEVLEQIRNIFHNELPEKSEDMGEAEIEVLQLALEEAKNGDVFDYNEFMTN